MESRTTFCFFCILTLPVILFAQTKVGALDVPQKPLFDFLGQAEIPEIILTANFDSLELNKKSTSYYFGSFEMMEGKDASIKLDVKLRARGKSRRMMCDFPPLKLKFSKEDLKTNGIEPFNDFKLVTHCKENDEASSSLVMKEFLIYQLFNQLTPYSFKVKLVRVTYKNTGDSFNKIKQLGILIEDAESLATRNGCQTLEKKVISLDSLHRHQEKITSVFQYMIGNADWSYLMARNTELILLPDGQIVPVPYDFDYAGMVKAPYARANAALGQQSVLDRVYLGMCKQYDDLQVVFGEFSKAKPSMEKLIGEFNKLDRNSRQEMLAYMQEFFKIMDERPRVEKEMLAGSKK